jgi:hypothetical protein
MLGCFDTVTLWCRKKNDETGNHEFTRTIVPVKCKWRVRENRLSSESGAVVKRFANVVIPRENGYNFGGNIGDYVALGAHEVEITGEKPYRAADVKELLRPDFFQIENIRDNTNSSIGKHWKVEGIV